MFNHCQKPAISQLGALDTQKKSVGTKFKVIACASSICNMCKFVIYFKFDAETIELLMVLCHYSDDFGESSLF